MTSFPRRQQNRSFGWLFLMYSMVLYILGVTIMDFILLITGSVFWQMDICFQILMGYFGVYFFASMGLVCIMCCCAPCYLSIYRLYRRCLRRIRSIPDRLQINEMIRRPQGISIADAQNYGLITRENITMTVVTLDPMGNQTIQIVPALPADRIRYNAEFGRVDVVLLSNPPPFVVMASLN